MFSHHAFVFRIGKNPVAPILFTQSVTLLVFSVLIGWSTLRLLATGDVHELISSSSLTLATANNRVSASDTVSRLQLELRRSNCNCLVSVQTGQRAATNEIKPAEAELLPSESHATANVSLFAR